MMLWSLISAKASPGVTTTALAAVAASAEGEAMVAELDPAGADLAVRAQVAYEPPSLVALAAAGRRGLTPELVAAHTCVIGPGLTVLFGPTDGTRASMLLTATGVALGQALAHLKGYVFADCGRWSPGSPSSPILAAAATTVVVLRPDPAEVEHVRCILPELGTLAADVVVAVVGRRPCSADEVAEVLGLDLIGVLENDPSTAGGLARAHSRKGVRRTPLVRSVASMVEALASRSLKSTESAGPAGSVGPKPGVQITR
jgi:MinD-like ATPase involved in chromosome partitioning or flagellar assembly